MKPSQSAASAVHYPTVDDCHAALEKAKATHAKAFAACESAQAQFFETGTAADEQALETARAAAGSAANHVARAGHLLGTAMARRRVEEETELEQKLADSERKHAELEAIAEALKDRETDAFVRVVEIREERLTINQAIAAEKAKIGAIHGALGLPYAPFDLAMTEIMPSHFYVADRLRALANRLSGQSPRARWLHELAEGTPTYHWQDPQHPMRLAAAKGSKS